MSRASARAYDNLQAELAADERRAIEAAGGVAPNPDWSPRTIVQSKLATLIDMAGAKPANLYRARCSCGFEGREYVAVYYAKARDEARAHRCAS